MITFLQAHRTNQSENKLLEKVLLERKRILMKMKPSDAQAVIDTFARNYSSGQLRISTMQKLKIALLGIWNSSYRNVVSFILHMSLEKVRLRIEETNEAGLANLAIEFKE